MISQEPQDQKKTLPVFIDSTTRPAYWHPEGAALYLPPELTLASVLLLLDKIKRFNGAAPFSVLEHLVVGGLILKHERSAPRRMVCAWLFHDLHEAFVQDLTKTTQALFVSRPLYYEACAVADDALRSRFEFFRSVTNEDLEKIEEFDAEMARLEMQEFFTPADTPESLSLFSRLDRLRTSILLEYYRLFMEA